MGKHEPAAVEPPGRRAQSRRNAESPQAVRAVRWVIAREGAPGLRHDPHEAQNWTGVRLRAWRDSLTAAGLASATVEKYASAVRCYFEWAVAAEVNDLTEPRVIGEWFDTLAVRSVGTARTYWTAMKAFWRWAHENSWINADPMATVVRPAPTPPRFEDILEARGLAVATTAPVPTPIRRRNVWDLDHEHASGETFKAASA